MVPTQNLIIVEWTEPIVKVYICPASRLGLFTIQVKTIKRPLHAPMLHLEVRTIIQPIVSLLTMMMQAILNRPDRTVARRKEKK